MARGPDEGPLQAISKSEDKPCSDKRKGQRNEGEEVVERDTRAMSVVKQQLPDRSRCLVLDHQFF